MSDAKKIRRQHRIVGARLVGVPNARMVADSLYKLSKVWTGFWMSLDNKTIWCVQYNPRLNAYTLTKNKQEWVETYNVENLPPEYEQPPILHI